MCSSPFPEVAESVQEELDTYRAQEDEVKRLKSIMVRQDVVDHVVGSSNLVQVRGHVRVMTVTFTAIEGGAYHPHLSTVQVSKVTSRPLKVFPGP